MSDVWLRRAARVARRALGELPATGTKYGTETRFWERELRRLVAWLNGELRQHYRTPCPRPEQIIPAPTAVESALRTWFELHQKPKYLADLELGAGAFAGGRLLDVGCGPYPSAEAFADCALMCLDPLLLQYRLLGYPLDGYRPRTRWICGWSETIPLVEDSVDAVISVNAIDHVDDFALAAGEIGRVLRPGGRLRMHVHYHRPTPTEPQELSDSTVREAFAWCRGLEKIAESTGKFSGDAAAGEAFALWSNFR